MENTLDIGVLSRCAADGEGDAQYAFAADLSRTGEGEESGEFLSVLHYARGQRYRPHFDCIPARPGREASGQTVKTAILFLIEAAGRRNAFSCARSQI